MTGPGSSPVGRPDPVAASRFLSPMRFVTGLNLDPDHYRPALGPTVETDCVEPERVR